jgi:hypothetical protein
MMGQDAQVTGFNRALVKFMRDNPEAYLSIKDNRCAQLMFEEDINDERHVATLAATYVATIEEEVQLSKGA